MRKIVDALNVELRTTSTPTYRYTLYLNIDVNASRRSIKSSYTIPFRKIDDFLNVVNLHGINLDFDIQQTAPALPAAPPSTLPHLQLYNTTTCLAKVHLLQVNIP